MTFTPFAVSHVVPAYGYVVSKPGRSVVFSGDTEPTAGLWAAARARAKNLKAHLPRALVFGRPARGRSAPRGTSRRRSFGQELAKAPPRVPIYLYHMKPPSLARIRREIAALDEPRLRLLDSERSFRF